MNTYHVLVEMFKLITEIEATLRQQEETRRKLDDLWAKFGHAVREGRYQKRVSLEGLSKSMGISKSALSYCETGLRSWNIELAMKAIEGLKT